MDQQNTVINSDRVNYSKDSSGQTIDTEKYFKQSSANKIPVCNTLALDSYREMCTIPQSKAQPCGTDEVGKIYRALKKFFIVMRGIKKYLDKYVNQTINAVQNLQSEIRGVITEIAGVLKTLVHRAREWVLKKVKAGIGDLLTKTLPPQGQEPKKALLNRIIDEIFCKFDEIIAGLFNLVGDFLYSLIGKVLNIPFCAAENFVNALINKVLNDIDKALTPIFNQINKALAPVAKIMGSVFQAIDFILGFEGFLCEKPECNDELREFAAGPWGSPQNSKTDNWSNFKFSSAVGKSLNGWMDDFFGAGKNGNYVSPGGCNAGEYKCGVQVEIFGGGGSGAVGAAVVNTIGQVVGVNLFNSGSGYTSPPFVSFVDPGGCGSGASAIAEINDNGQVTQIIPQQPGIGYTNLVKTPPIINSFTATPNPINVNNAITFSWETVNSDGVSLGIPGYTVLPPVGSQSINITDADVNFPYGQSSTTITYTLTAIKKYSDSPQQETTQKLDVTVQQPTSSIVQNPPPQTSSNPPSILSFVATPSTATVGNVIKFSWQTTDATTVGLGTSNPTSGVITPIYSNLVPNGSASLVLPNVLPFPNDGSNLINYYVLTATNSNAPAANNTDTEVAEVVITPPQTTIQQTNNQFIPQTSNNSTNTIINTGITNQETGGEDSGGTNLFPNQNNSGSITVGTGGTVGAGSSQLGGSGGGGGGGSQQTDPTNTQFSPITGGSFTSGGAAIDPSGSVGGNGSFVSGSGQSIPAVTGDPTTGAGGIGGVGGGGEVPGISTNVPISGGGATGNNIVNVISEISEIKIINTGSGYSPNDKIEIVGGNNNAELKLEVSPTGQIINVDIISRGYGFVTIPQIRINSDTGAGAQFRSVLRFTPASKFTEEELRIIGTEKLLKVIDCVTR